MEKTTILEKLKIVFEISKSSKLFILIILALIILAVVGITTTKKTKKRSRKIYTAVYIFIIISLIIMYYESLGKMFDYMMNNLFIVIYFPNIAVYLAAIIITNIILCISIFNLKITKIIKTINIVVYSILHYLLALILSVVVTKKLDVFSQSSLYSNKEIHALIELSSAIFLIWIIFLTIYKIIRMYQLRNKVIVRKKVIVKKVRILPDNISEVKAPDFVKVQLKEQEEIKNNANDSILINEHTNDFSKEQEELKENLEKTQKQLKIAQAQIKLHEELAEKQQAKIKYEQEQIDKYQQEIEKLKNNNHKQKNSTTAIMESLDGMLTLEDYKVLATLLKDKQKKKNEEQNKEKEEYEPFTQIRETYKSVR